MTESERLSDAARKLQTAESIIDHVALNGVHEVSIELIRALLTPVRIALNSDDVGVIGGEGVNGKGTEKDA